MYIYTHTHIYIYIYINIYMYMHICVCVRSARVRTAKKCCRDVGGRLALGRLVLVGGGFSGSPARSDVVCRGCTYAFVRFVGVASCGDSRQEIIRSLG